MYDNLRLNTKLISFQGIIGRRDYFLNIIYILCISTFFMIPYTLYIATHINSLENYFDVGKIFLASPILLKIWTLAGIIFTCFASLSNIIRRLNDISGKVNNLLNISISIIMALANFGIIFPLFISLILWFIRFIIGLVLIFKQGKITKTFPYDVTKEFNWGAFFGTWIWGLVNKSYLTLLMLILSFTPFGLYFALICGLKGNEWAYKNKKWENIEKFNKSQETQATIFIILYFIAIPLLYFLIFIIIAVSTLFLVSDPSNPDKMEKNINRLETTVYKFANLYFENHTISETENKFYVNPDEWKNYSFSEKKNIIDIAASISISERRKIEEEKNPKSFKYFSKTDELNRTKIYSSKTNELLGEYYVDENILNKDFKSIAKASFNAYRFYNPSK